MRQYLPQNRIFSVAYCHTLLRAVRAGVRAYALAASAAAVGVVTSRKIADGEYLTRVQLLESNGAGIIPRDGASEGLSAVCTYVESGTKERAAAAVARARVRGAIVSEEVPSEETHAQAAVLSHKLRIARGATPVLARTASYVSIMPTDAPTSSSFVMCVGGMPAGHGSEA